MREKILTALQTKFQGVDAKTLGRIADKLAKTTTAEADIQTAVDGVTFQQVMESYGDARVTDAQKTAVENYEKKHGLKDGKRADTQETQAPGQEEDGATDTTTTKTEETKSDDTAPAWAKALIEQNKALTERLNRMEGEKTRATRKEQMNGITGQLPAELRKAYDRIAVDTLTEDEFSALKEEIATEVSGINRQLKASGAVFTAPAKTDGEAKETLSKKEADAFLHAMNLTPTKKD